jgi:hypothetical protein
MQPRWTPHIPQAMQQHGTPPKDAPLPEKAKHVPRESDAPKPAYGTTERPKDRAA